MVIPQNFDEFIKGADKAVHNLKVLAAAGIRPVLLGRKFKGGVGLVTDLKEPLSWRRCLGGLIFNAEVTPLRR
jgi:hypothetical protein